MALSIKANLAALSTLSIALAACAAGSPPGSGHEDSARNPARESGFHGHMMPMKGLQKAAKLAAASGPQLVYNGGPVLSSVKVWTVYWGAGVGSQSELDAFYASITSSAYFDWLSEYNTPSQTIGRGSFGGSVVDQSPPSGSSVDDSQVQAELARLIDAGKLPQNDANNLYMVYFPPGVSIVNGGSQSCVQFCAYHGSFTHGGSDAYYGIVPDLGGACAGGCGGDSQFNNTTSVSSHEMIEAVTDAAVAANNLAWYDQANGEIGDICNAQQGTVGNYVIQLEWSNQAGACIATAPGGGSSGSGSSGSASSGSGSSGSGSSGSGSSGSGSSGSGSGGAGGSGTGGSGAGGSGATGGGTGSGGGGCNICASSGPLDPSCDPCAATVCQSDSYCCATAWDATCVSEVASICNLACN